LNERAFPGMSGDELTTLAEFLEWYRATALLKVEGLSDEQAPPLFYTDDDLDGVTGD